MTFAHKQAFSTLFLVTFVYQTVLAASGGHQESCEGSAGAPLRSSSLLQRQHVQGTSSELSAVEELGHGCGEQRITPMLDSENVLNALLLQPESQGLGFIHIPQNAGERIESFGLNNGLKWGFNAINHTYFQKLQLTSNKICTWHVVPPRFLPGVKVYTNKPLFCVTRDPIERLFSTYLSVIKMLDHDCPISKSDLDILSRYERCTPESLNYFATAALKSSEFDFDCNLIPQSTYVWDWDGKQVCKEVIKFEDLPTALPALMARYKTDVSQSASLPALLQTSEQGAHGSESSLCPGLSSADFDANSTLAIRDHYHDDLVNLGYD